MNAIKKLQEHNIFKRDSIVESTIMKDWMGSPVEKKVHLIVRKTEQRIACVRSTVRQTARHTRSSSWTYQQ
jgi:hypothetical protein